MNEQPHLYFHVLTVIDSRDEAERIARVAVEKHLAACAQVSGPIMSVYRWKGAVETATEWQVWLKTSGTRVEPLISLIKQEHRYDVPEIIASPITSGNPGYLQWIIDETAQQRP
jgi:periplasmic divalent cation tolerance protein